MHVLEPKAGYANRSKRASPERDVARLQLGIKRGAFPWQYSPRRERWHGRLALAQRDYRGNVIVARRIQRPTPSIPSHPATHATA